MRSRRQILQAALLGLGLTLVEVYGSSSVREKKAPRPREVRFTLSHPAMAEGLRVWEGGIELRRDEFHFDPEKGAVTLL